MVEYVKKDNIVSAVKKSVMKARKEIIATMLLSEDIKQPLSPSYHNLLRQKLKKGVVIKRLGFGSEDEYNKVNTLLPMSSKGYTFRYIKDISMYQRFILIDKSYLFFGTNGVFMQSTYKPLISVFVKYFLIRFKYAV